MILDLQALRDDFWWIGIAFQSVRNILRSSDLFDIMCVSIKFRVQKNGDPFPLLTHFKGGCHAITAMARG